MPRLGGYFSIAVDGVAMAINKTADQPEGCHHCFRYGCARSFVFSAIRMISYASWSYTAGCNWNWPRQTHRTAVGGDRCLCYRRRTFPCRQAQCDGYRLVFDKRIHGLHQGTDFTHSSVLISPPALHLRIKIQPESAVDDAVVRHQLGRSITPVIRWHLSEMITQADGA